MPRVDSFGRVSLVSLLFSLMMSLMMALNDVVDAGVNAGVKAGIDAGTNAGLNAGANAGANPGTNRSLVAGVCHANVAMLALWLLSYLADAVGPVGGRVRCVRVFPGQCATLNAMAQVLITGLAERRGCRSICLGPPLFQWVYRYIRRSPSPVQRFR